MRHLYAPPRQPAFVATCARLPTPRQLCARPRTRRLATQPCPATRVIAVVAHVDAGKTTLTEEMLSAAGALGASGRVDAGSATTDFLEQERERGITIQSAAAYFAWNNTTIALVDTPGHVDFGFEVDRTLRAVDGVVLVVDAVAGAQARTEAVARAARETFDLPMVAVVNKMDRAGADFDGATKSLVDRCDLRPIIVQTPLYAGDVFEGPRDLVAARDLPLAEALADLDDAFAEQYLEDAWTSQDLAHAIARQTKSKKMVPVLCAAALKGVGVSKVLDAVTSYLPSPREVLRDETDFAALIFKVSHDPRRGPLCFARCYGGVLLPKTQVAVANPASPLGGRLPMERPQQFLKPFADDLEVSNAFRAGEVRVVTGLRNARTGDTLLAKDGAQATRHAKSVAHAALPATTAPPPPVFAAAVEPLSTVDLANLEDALELMCRDDPSLSVSDEDGGLVLRGAGELHLEVACDRLRSDFGVQALLSRPRVALRESIETTFEHTSDIVYDATLGGQRLVCGLRLKLAPLCTEEAYDAEVPIVVCDGALPPLLREALEEGLAAAATRGVLRGHALAGVAIEALSVTVDGPATTPGAVRACAALALADALNRARPVLLEPVVLLEIEAPDRCVGDVLSDLATARRAKVLDVTSRADRSLVVAHAPLETLLGYSTALRSLSQGEATFAQAFAHLAPRTG